MQQVLKGSISITDNLNFINEVLYSMPYTRVISLDENNTINTEHPNVIGGTCLLPPINALIAEADGDEGLFDMYYAEHFTTSFVDMFMGAIINYLISGGDLVIYYPELNSIIASKLMDMIWKRYGIGIGIVGQKEHFYDYSCLPIWLGYAYTNKVINARDYLKVMPTNVIIPDLIMNQIIFEISPLEDDYNDSVNYIYSLVHKFKEKPGLIIPIYRKIKD